MTYDLILTMKCPFCGEEHGVRTTAKAYYAWQAGELIQNAMPFLNATAREQLISHICPRCQESMFGSEDEEDDPEDYDIFSDPADETRLDPYKGCFTYDC